MGSQHKAPLAAFFVVSVACFVVVANALVHNADALTGFLRAPVQAVVAGAHLLPRGGGSAEPAERPAAVAAPGASSSGAPSSGSSSSGSAPSAVAADEDHRQGRADHDRRRHPRAGEAAEAPEGSEPGPGTGDDSAVPVSVPSAPVPTMAARPPHDVAPVRLPERAEHGRPRSAHGSSSGPGAPGRSEERGHARPAVSGTPGGQDRGRGPRPGHGGPGQGGPGQGGPGQGGPGHGPGHGGPGHGPGHGGPGHGGPGHGVGPGHGRGR